MSFGRRPRFTPRAFARCLPSAVRARVRSRSNSANPPSTVNISRPCDVVVSAHASPGRLEAAMMEERRVYYFQRYFHSKIQVPDPLWESIRDEARELLL